MQNAGFVLAKEYPMPPKLAAEADARLDISNLNSRLDQLLENLQECRGKVGIAADRLFGNRPENPSGVSPGRTQFYRRTSSVVGKVCGTPLPTSRSFLE